jgi:hypothetical protein
MEAGLCITADKEGREHCLVVVKGTFVMDAKGEPRLAEAQRSLVYADEHHGTPETTSLRHECDFALTKSRTDVLVQGHAVAPMGRPVEKMLVRLEMPERRKDLLVTGARVWEKGLVGLRASAPRPFIRMPLVYERAFGGSDNSHPEPRYKGTELRNPVGVGFRKNPRVADAVGTPLPCIESREQPLSRWDQRPPPVGFGPVGRGWQPRIAHAGTYDARWLEEDFPFLPRDFDACYFQCAPEDQQLPLLRGGEVFRCMGIMEAGTWSVRMPVLRVPVAFHFHHRLLEAEPRLDTVLMDCDAKEVVVTWRASVPLGKKLTNLREVLVGPAPPPPSMEPVEYRKGKPYFRGLGALVAWRRRWQGHGGST